MRADRWAVAGVMATAVLCTNGSAWWAWIPALVAMLCTIAVVLRFGEWISSGRPRR